jgi:DNA-binding CsgD family transcriptional regulator
VASEGIALALSELYEAAITPDAWPDALSNFARATNSVGCRFRPAEPEAAVRFPASPELAEFLHDFHLEGWGLSDPRTSRGVPMVKSGRTVILDHDIADDEERRRSPFYQTLLRRHDLPWWAAIAFSVDGSPCVLSILRSAVQGAFTPADARDFADIAPHLGRVASLASKFALAQGIAAVEALERVGRAAFVIDSAGRIVAGNSLAEKNAGGDLVLSRGRLYATDRASDRRLQDLITRAVAPQAAGSPGLDPVFARRSEGRPFMVEAFPANRPMRDVFRRIAALVVITDLEARAKPAEALIREAFGLTPAEGRLAFALAGGEDMRQAADRLGVAYETARAQLKAIFGKMQVSRQAELTAALTKIAPGGEKQALA